MHGKADAVLRREGKKMFLYYTVLAILAAIGIIISEIYASIDE